MLKRPPFHFLTMWFRRSDGILFNVDAESVAYKRLVKDKTFEPVKENEGNGQPQEPDMEPGEPPSDPGQGSTGKRGGARGKNKAKDPERTEDGTAVSPRSDNKAGRQKDFLNSASKPKRVMTNALLQDQGSIARPRRASRRHPIPAGSSIRSELIKPAT
jgi:hypothetical protein